MLPGQAELFLSVFLFVFSVFACVFVCLCVFCLFVCISVFVCLCVCLLVCLFVYVCVYLCVCFFLAFFVCLCLCLCHCLLVCLCVWLFVCLFAFCCMAERWSEFFTWGEIFRILPSISVFFLLKCLKFQLSFYIFSFFLSFSSCQYHFTFTTSLNLWHFGMINLCFSFSHDQRKLSYLEKEKKIRKSIF